jgi:hypothetical protein
VNLKTAKDLMKELSYTTKLAKKQICEKIQETLKEFLQDDFKWGRKRKKLGHEFWCVITKRTKKRNKRKILAETKAKLSIEIS